MNNIVLPKRTIRFDHNCHPLSSVVSCDRSKWYNTCINKYTTCGCCAHEWATNCIFWNASKSESPVKKQHEFERLLLSLCSNHYHFLPTYFLSCSLSWTTDAMPPLMRLFYRLFPFETTSFRAAPCPYLRLELTICCEQDVATFLLVASGFLYYN